MQWILQRYGVEYIKDEPAKLCRGNQCSSKKKSECSSKKKSECSSKKKSECSSKKKSECSFEHDCDENSIFFQKRFSEKKMSSYDLD